MSKQQHWWMRGRIPQEPHAPARAYAVMVTLLPRSYFLRRPPESGWCFEVTGVDGQPTTWYIPDHLAVSIEALLRANRDIKSVRCAPFDNSSQEAA